MGFLITPTPHLANTAPPEIAQEGDIEGLSAEEAELESEAQAGCLKTQSRTYAFIKQEGANLFQSLQDYLSGPPQTLKNKPFDLNPKEQSPSKTTSNESLLKTKAFKLTSLAETKAATSLPNRTHVLANQNLEKALLPPSIKQLKESAPLKQQQTQARTLEAKLQRQFSHSTTLNSPPHTEGKTVSHHKEKERPREEKELNFVRLEKNEEKELNKKKQDEEEGVAGEYYRQQQETNEEGGRKGFKVEESREGFKQQFDDYSCQESILSELAMTRVSQFDVLLLFLEILKLDIKSREQEKIARQQERELQLIHMQNVVDNYQNQSSWTKKTSIGAGIMAILSGALPIVGHMKGSWLIEKFGTIFESIKDMKKEQLFKSLSKITHAMSEMQKNTGQIHNTFAEGTRTYDQHMSDLHRSEWEEMTRSIDEIKDDWKGIENFLYQMLQMYHDASRQLYS